MDLELTEELRLLQEAARELAEDVLKPAAARADREERLPAEHWRRLAEMGFFGLLIPEEHGGTALGNDALSIVLMEVNRACASTGVTLSVQGSLIPGPLVKHGTEEQKRRYLPRIASGEIVCAYALTEPEHGSDAGAIETTATRKGDRYLLNGRKAWITNGASAGLLLVFATTDRSLGSKGITAFLVERSGSKGLSAGKREKKLGIRGSETVELALEDVEVPAENVLGQPGQGYKLALETLDGGRIGIAAQAAGILAACLEDSLRYARERKQFGKPIAELQAIQWKLSNMAVDLEAARHLVLRAAWLRDAGRPHTKEASIAKLFASEAANRAATQAVQIHGGAGYCKDFPVERYYRDAKITEIYEGTSEIQRIVIARQILEP
ncbi:MAG: acyl-CoA dehydrogenase family protein [Planctomycetes bacterium]|nr:acyl-CoA dehydrogenase family protein [Planctomycetota bacterium]